MHQMYKKNLEFDKKKYLGFEFSLRWWFVQPNKVVLDVTIPHKFMSIEIAAGLNAIKLFTAVIL